MPWPGEACSAPLFLASVGSNLCSFSHRLAMQTSLTRALTQTLTLTLTLALTLTLLWTQARKQDLGLCAAGVAPRVTTPEQGWPDSAPTLTPYPNPNPSPVTRALTFRPGAGRPRHSGCQPGARTARRKPQLPGDPDPNPSLCNPKRSPDPNPNLIPNPNPNPSPNPSLSPSPNLKPAPEPQSRPYRSSCGISA